MRIVVDARAASHPQRGGFKTYTENLVRHLPLVDPESQFVFFVDRAVSGEEWRRPNVSVRVLHSYLPSVGVVWREQIQLPLQLWQLPVDLAHFPANTAALASPAPLIVTIHDTITWTEWNHVSGLSPRQALKRLGLRWYDSHLSRIAAGRAGTIITDSINSQRDIQRATGLPLERVHVVYPAPAVQVELSPEQLQAIRADFQLDSPFILGLGSASPRKNLVGIIRAYASLPESLIQDYQLVIVWTHGLWRNNIKRLVEAHGLQRRVRFMDVVSEAQLSALYRLASLFIYPSFYEGFGMPPLEAMSCGTPVVAANTSCLPEVLGNAAILTNPYDVQDIARAVHNVLINQPASRELIANGYRQSARYSWQRTARETIEVYRSVLAKSREKVQRKRNALPVEREDYSPTDATQVDV